ncbi:hypothetical protein ABTH94_20150, partial [Acinetobacter baumannii]
LSLKWLSEFIPQMNSEDPHHLTHELTMAGIEVENVITTADDTVLELSITPNRGDCLSIYGLARELAVIRGLELSVPDIHMDKPALTERVF